MLKGPTSNLFYVQSVAYHEAGHIVVAAVLGLRISRHGISCDGEGGGMSYYEFRKPKSWTAEPSEIGIRETIVATLAGFIAQRKFYPECSPNGASDDENLVDALLKELLQDDFIGLDVLSRTQLEEEATTLVDRHWVPITALASSLLTKQLTTREAEPNPTWSASATARKLHGAEIASILSNFGLLVRLSD